MTRKRLKAPRHFGQGGFLHSVEDINEILDREWPRLVADSALSRAGGENTGAAQILAERAGLVLNLTAESVLRRIYDIHTKKLNTVVTARLAEALLDGVGTSSSEERIPTLPGGMGAAKEMVETHLWVKEEEMSEMEVTRLARSLINFTAGYLYTDAEIIEEEVEEAA